MWTPTRPALLCGLLCGSVACLPPDPPDWVAHHPTTWGIAVRVVDDGFFAGDVVVPPNHSRAEVLPDDTIELQWYGAGPEGADVRPPIWIAMSDPGGPYAQSKIASLLKGELSQCPERLSLLPSLCRLGSGDRVSVRIGTNSLPIIYDVHYRPLHLMTIASDGAVIDPETCLQRVLGERYPQLAGCLFTTRTVEVGPDATLWKQFGPLVAPEQVPPEFFTVAANFNPVIDRLELTRTVAGSEVVTVVHDGDSIAVDDGETLVLRIRLAPDARQEYFAFSLGDHGEIDGRLVEEHLETITRFGADVDGYLASEDGLEHRWTVAEAATLYLQIGDNRGGRAFASLRFIVDEDP